ncbi:MmgE/PrpD family protein [Micromonospora endophytica]|uniref:2-methylcitrate dehydratase n=1 Tax=Micromonospora endophytica TaxID=515350 RepID=A0A2W2E1N2_9ACTN|nr:MmgE/PrpD family protein [Micromonospora endophytica]PZF98893.1 2-methylcitrate dehydratase [Micromonospora endophytica]RIW44370.1 MmgE/PrpD family protein [Micromonospora endophytica]BCJ62432.1 MmgE/Prp family protein [Micromonospora endophytica]
MAEQTLGQRLAAFAVDTSAADLPAEVVGSVRQRVLDVLGLCVAAYPLPTSQAVLAYVREQGGRGQAQAIGLETPVPAALAAFANGVLAHSLDYDDTHLPSVLHPSASVVPAALAAAEASGASGRETVAAIAVGIEVCVRLGMAGYDRAAGNSVFFEHGQHATSICGTLGGAVAAARLFGLDAGQTLDSLGVAASMAAGLIEANRTGGTVKRIHCGWAAHSAVTAASLARHGITGPPTVLEGRFGFFQAFLRGEFDPAEVVDGLGTNWAVPDIFFKPYPANHFTHAAIDAAIALRERGLRVEEIDTITLGVPTPVIRTIGAPLERKQAPRTGYEAQFSGPYAVVAGLYGGGVLGVGPDDFTDALAVDPDRRSLMARVQVVPDDRCDAIFPYQFPAVLRVRTRDGQVWTEEVLANRGGPQRPLSADELARKFHHNVAGRLAADVANQVEQEIDRLDQAADVTRLTGLLAAVATAPTPTGTPTAGPFEE